MFLENILKKIFKNKTNLSKAKPVKKELPSLDEIYKELFNLELGDYNLNYPAFSINNILNKKGGWVCVSSDKHGNRDLLWISNRYTHYPSS